MGFRYLLFIIQYVIIVKLSELQFSPVKGRRGLECQRETESVTRDALHVSQKKAEKICYIEGVVADTVAVAVRLHNTIILSLYYVLITFENL